MTAQEKLHSQAATLRRKLAEAEATADQHRAKLAILEARLTGGPVPLSGLELLWQTALPKARERSSKHRCRTAWNRIPQAERPPISTLIAALKTWNRAEDWKRDNNQFAPGLHRFITDRMWEALPEGVTPSARYRSTPKALPIIAPEDIATPADIAAIFGRRAGTYVQAVAPATLDSALPKDVMAG
jgi:hypothetical protein